MSTYVMSDIHGCYDAFLKMLDKIKFADGDILIIDGDVLDRGDKPIATLIHIMKNKNMELLCGNHELMAVLCLKLLIVEYTEETLKQFDMSKMGQLMEWQQNGGTPTMRDLRKYSKETQKTIYNYLTRLKLYKELEINDQKYLIVHAGLGGFKKSKKLKEYTINELVWDRPDYEKMYFKDKMFITGHTPTLAINGKDKIYYNKNNIAIDCGCTFGGKLACLRLDDMKEFYVKAK